MRTATDFSRAEIGKTNVCAFCYFDNAYVCVHVNMYVCIAPQCFTVDFIIPRIQHIHTYIHTYIRH